MSSEAFRVSQIDHIEVFVPDRYEAAKWYQEVFGLEILREHEHWASPTGGPLMISSDGGGTMIALFMGEPRGARQTTGHHRVALRVSGAGFIQFIDRLETVPIFDDDGQQLTPTDVRDHGKAFSIYFNDPYGNRYEITTYDYDHVAGALPERQR